MQYYTLGKYPKKIDVARARKNLSTPGQAAKINERNPQPSDDVNVKATASMAGDGCFYNAGQSCCAVERLYVHESIYDEFTAELTTFAESLKVGDPEDKETYLGPLTRKDQIKVLRSCFNPNLSADISFYFTRQDIRKWPVCE